MRIVKLTAADFTERNGRKEYSGSEVLEGLADISIEIDEGLGWVWFPRLSVRGYILASKQASRSLLNF